LHIHGFEKLYGADGSVPGNLIAEVEPFLFGGYIVRVCATYRRHNARQDDVREPCYIIDRLQVE
jgi:hypothetical protein